MKNVFFKYCSIGAAISFCVLCIIELVFNGEYNFDWSHVILYTLVFTLQYALCMSAVSYYNAKLKTQEDPVEEEVSKDGGVIYYYNDYVNGFCRVERIEYDSPKDFERNTYRKYFGFVNKEGELINKKWYVGASDFFENGVAVVELYDKAGKEIFNVINKEGEELSVSWFYSIYGYSDGVCKVGWSDGTINFIDENGNLLWKEWKKELEIEHQEDN